MHRYIQGQMLRILERLVMNWNLNKLSDAEIEEVKAQIQFMKEYHKYFSSVHLHQKSV